MRPPTRLRDSGTRPPGLGPPSLGGPLAFLASNKALRYSIYMHKNGAILAPFVVLAALVWAGRQGRLRPTLTVGRWVGGALRGGARLFGYCWRLASPWCSSAASRCSSRRSWSSAAIRRSGSVWTLRASSSRPDMWLHRGQGEVVRLAARSSSVTPWAFLIPIQPHRRQRTWGCRPPGTGSSMPPPLPQIRTGMICPSRPLRVPTGPPVGGP